MQPRLPRTVFGYHEVFHTVVHILVVAASAVHYVAVVPGVLPTSWQLDPAGRPRYAWGMADPAHLRIEAALLIPGDGEPLRDACVVLRGPTIAWVGPRREAPR